MQWTKAKPNILITRPKPAGAVLCDKVNAAGYHAVLFPTIEFLPPQQPQAMPKIIAELDQYDWLIFISPQAVNATSAMLHKRWRRWPAQLKIAAVGAGTASALAEEKFTGVIHPSEQWNSEGLLELPELQNPAGEKIVLVRGEGGRELLADTLAERGAQVTPLIAYRRVLPKVSVKNIVTLLRKHTLDAIVCTSGEGLQNLTILLAAEQQKLISVPLVVISQRMQDQARELGFDSILLAKNASHDAIMAVLNEEFALKSQQGSAMENQTEHETQAEPVVNARRGTRSAWGSIGILFSACSFIVLVAAFYFSYNALMASDNKLAAATASISNQIAANQQEITTLRQAVTEAQNNSKTLQDALQAQQDSINKIHNTDQTKDALNVGEAQYLAALAQDNLQIGDNVPLVINLLQTADQKIRDLTDPKLLPLRKAFATDIAALQAVPTVDITGIYLQLAALNNQVDKLPLPTLRPAQETTEATPGGKRVVWWKRGLQNSWDVIRKMVVIRYNKSGQVPFITPEQQQYLYQNLHAMFEQAMSAVVHKQPQIYQASLTQAADWIRQYFIGDAAATQAMLTSLTQLQAQNIKPALPTIDATLQALRDFATVSAAADTPATTTSQQ
jgi:uroporphyrinogen III methyltransferase / synthase